MTSSHCYSFGAYTLDAKRGSLVRDGAEVRLRPQSFKVLLYLVERPGQLIAKDELLQAIWGNTIVTDGSLTQCLIDIRKAIDDSSRQVLRTVPRRGVIFEHPVTAGDAPRPAERVPVPAPRPGIRRRRRPLMILPAALVVVVAAAWLWRTGMPVPSGSVTAPGSVAAAAPSVAVLPFVDMSEHGDQEYFSDGIAEEILNLLTDVPGLQVIARTSSFSFKGQPVDIARIARKLEVAYVLEGSVRKSGDRIRVTAQLVDAGTGMHLWSETYDGESGAVLELQSNIAAAVAAALEVTLADRNSAAEEVSAEAYEELLRARFFYNRRGKGDVALAAKYFEAALAIDPQYGQAWTGLAATWLVRMSDGEVERAEGFAEMGRAVVQALKYAANDPETHVRAGQYFSWADDPEMVSRHRKRAIELGPDNPLVLSWLAGMATDEGRLDLAIERLERATELDPLVLSYHNNLAVTLMAADRLPAAREEILKALELSPDDEIRFWLPLLDVLEGGYRDALAAVESWPEGPDRDQVLAMAKFGLGEEAEGEAALLRLRSSGEPDTRFRVPAVLAWRGDREAAFERIDAILDGIEAASPEPRREGREAWVEIQLSPFLAPLRDDPHWEDIRERTHRSKGADLLAGH